MLNDAFLNDMLDGVMDKVEEALEAAEKRQSGELLFTIQSADIAANAFAPNDTFYGLQWHLFDTYGIRADQVWDDYTGEGITISFIDNGIEYTHEDLNDNYDDTIDYDSQTNTNDGAPRTSDDNHGTATSGIAAAEGDNAQGVTGVAFGADVTSTRLSFASGVSDAQLANLFHHQMDADISNNSWGITTQFGDNFNGGLAQTGAAILDAALDGRGGLGTNIVFSAGNDRTTGDNTNYHNMKNSPFTIAVGATDQNGHFASFSTPGATVLTSAPGVNITTTDREGAAGYVSSGYVSGLGGTSASAPMVSGAIALMLEANADLGYRDVQEILAYSSRNSDASFSDWQFNGADNWNGGGLHFSHQYGFGLLDAHAAVRLAETWETQHTGHNVNVIYSAQSNVNSTIPNNSVVGISDSIMINNDRIIDRVEVNLDISHGNIGDLIVTLTSPDGTVSTLINRPGLNPDSPSGRGNSSNNIDFTLGSNGFWSEHSAGEWTLTVYDRYATTTGSFNDWSMVFYGDEDSANDTYIYTDEYANVAGDILRNTLHDAEGVDTLNLAAITSNTNLSLIAGVASTVAGQAFSVAADTTIENAYLGDGNDTVTGNGAANVVHGGRGNDSLFGGNNNDTLFGEQGNDTLNGGEQQDSLIGGEGDDYLIGGGNHDYLQGDNGNDTLGGGVGNDTLIGAEGDDSILGNSGDDSILAGDGNDWVDAGGWNDYVSGELGDDTIYGQDGNDTIFGGDGNDYLDGGRYNDVLDGGEGNDTLVGGSWNDTLLGGRHNDFLYGDDGEDYLDGGSWNDYLDGGRHNDTLIGGDGNDTLKGGSWDDLLQGGRQNDFLYGGFGNDTLDGGSWDDVLYGNGQDDYLYGFSGNDILIGGEGNDTLEGHWQNDTLTGESGYDVFMFGGNEGHDIITDFVQGEDVIHITDGLYNSAAQILGNITYAGGNALIQLEVDSDVLVENVAENSLVEADFLWS